MEIVLHGLRYAVRTLVRQPALTAMAVFTLALGIGANTAIYSVVDATLLRDLPFYEPDRLTSNLTGTGDPEQLRGELVSATYFPLLGVKAAVGRTFLPEEDVAPERDFVALISHSLWEGRYRSDPAAIS